MAIVKVEPEKLQQEYDGFELYYDNEKKFFCMTLKGLSTCLHCHCTSLRNISTILEIGVDSIIPTKQSSHKAVLYTEDEVVKIIMYLTTSKRIKNTTKQNAKSLLENIVQNGFIKGLSTHTPIKESKKSKRDKTDEKLVAKYLKDLHESVGDIVYLEKTIDLGYRPDMIIISPSTNLVMATEVEPYSRRRYGLQQAVTYAKFSHSNPYLVTFGEMEPCEKEQLTLGRYKIAWLHLQTITKKFEEAKMYNNFKFIKN